MSKSSSRHYARMRHARKLKSHRFHLPVMLDMSPGIAHARSSFGRQWNHGQQRAHSLLHSPYGPTSRCRLQTKPFSAVLHRVPSHKRTRDPQDPQVRVGWSDIATDESNRLTQANTRWTWTVGFTRRKSSTVPARHLMPPGSSPEWSIALVNHDS